MNNWTPKRQAVTMVELLVVLSIIAILLGLLVVAVVKVRESAARTQSENNLRQIMLATLNFATAHNSLLPICDADYGKDPPYYSLFVAILPYIEQEQLLRPDPNFVPQKPVLLYISPADPTAPAALGQQKGVSSYAANGQVFADQPRFPQSIPDGISNTIGFAEHYSYQCARGNFSRSFYYWEVNHFDDRTRATFAEGASVCPRTSGDPPVSVASLGALTFQVAPATNDCNAVIAQTPHRSGMLVAIMDGSVRTLAGNISEQTYWAAVTPAGGEMLGSDWPD